MVRVTSVPETVFRGAVRLMVALALPPASRIRLVGKVEAKPLSLLAWMLKFPPEPLVVTEKGTKSGVPGTRTVSAPA